MAMLGMAPVMQRELHTTYGLQPDVALGVGALLSSVFSATLSHPMDTIKTCMQGDVEQKKYSGALGTAKVLTAEYGVANGLFKGLVWRIALISTTFFFVNKSVQPQSYVAKHTLEQCKH
jgi:solute carrier family 25 carnitine/acylcarnitine transporter 20/29